ncbi:hypothetical protein RhiirC2_795995, partial [Rhizophagus irregularis]
LNIERLEYKNEFKSFWKIIIKEHEKQNLTPKAKLLTEDPPQPSQVDNKKINKSIKKNDDDNTSNLLIKLKERQNQNEDHYLSKQNENPETSHKKINKNIKRNNEEVTDDDPFINLKKRQRQNEDYIANESVLQVTIELLLPSRYRVPELCLIMNTAVNKGNGVCDERIKIINSNPNKLIGFVIVVIGFRRIIWRSVDEKSTNYRYIKIN